MAEAIQDLPGEIWKPVVGYEGEYSVSNLGRLRSERRVVACRNGRTKTIRQKILSARKLAGSGLAVCLRHDDRYLVHRLVLAAFVGPCPDRMEACHNNGDPADNRLKNLRWDTHENNEADKEAHGTKARGSKHGMAKLKECDIPEIRRRLENGETQQAIAADYGVAYTIIGRIKRRELWAHQPT